jgi:cholesterol transport system auxiliary component
MLVTGCSFGPAPAPPIAVYDFGIDTPKLQAVRFSATLALEDVRSPNWLHSPAIVYRLAYRDIARLHPYSLSRWAAPPPVLVTQRLRSALGKVARGSFTAVADGVRSDYVLRVDLDSFVQVVDAPNSARGIIRARASLIDAAQRSLRAQRMFEVEQSSPSVDAPGAVRALSAATDLLIAQLIDWTARQTGSAR